MKTFYALTLLTFLALPARAGHLTPHVQMKKPAPASIATPDGPPMPPRPRTIVLSSAVQPQSVPIQRTGDVLHTFVQTNGSHVIVILTANPNPPLKLFPSPMWPGRAKSLAVAGAPKWDWQEYIFFPPDPFQGRYFEGTIDHGIPPGLFEVLATTDFAGWATIYQTPWSDSTASFSLYLDENLPKYFIKSRSTPP